MPPKKVEIKSTPTVSSQEVKKHIKKEEIIKKPLEEVKDVKLRILPGVR